jgi:hypothetical protein
MKVDGIEYCFVTASHVAGGRDGLALECWRSNDIVFEIFRNDAALKLEVTLFEQDVPFDLVEHAVGIARSALSDFVP